MTKEILQGILDRVREDESVRPRDGKTYCNIALDMVLKEMGAERILNPLTGEPHLANSMICKFENSPTQWIKTNMASAASFAIKGNLVVAGQRGDIHGHISPTYPVISAYSPSWNKKVPMLSNVGKKNGIMRTSQCFRAEPEFWLYVGKSKV